MFLKCKKIKESENKWTGPSHPSQNRQVAKNSDFFFILQVLILVRVQHLSKGLFFSLTRTQNQKKPLFSTLLSRDVKFLSQREADVFKLHLYEKKMFL